MKRETIQNVKEFLVMAFGMLVCLGIMWMVAIMAGRV